PLTSVPPGPPPGGGELIGSWFTGTPRAACTSAVVRTRQAWPLSPTPAVAPGDGAGVAGEPVVRDGSGLQAAASSQASARTRRALRMVRWNGSGSLARDLYNRPEVRI